MVWMGDPNELAAVTVDGLLELGPSTQYSFVRSFVAVVGLWG
jgi:hypothetical protein